MTSWSISTSPPVRDPSLARMGFSGLLMPAIYSKRAIACRQVLEDVRPMDHVIESQEHVFALLADPATHGGAAVKRVDTHAAVAVLAGATRLMVSTVEWV